MKPSQMAPHLWYHLSHARVLKLENKRACAMLAAMTHPSRVLNLDIKAEAFFMPKSYVFQISIY